MEFRLDPDEIRPLVADVLREVLRENGGILAQPERLAFSEAEAATMLGVKSHVLRDERLKGNIDATQVGGRIAYTRQDLLDYLSAKRHESRLR